MQRQLYKVERGHPNSKIFCQVHNRDVETVGRHLLFTLSSLRGCRVNLRTLLFSYKIFSMQYQPRSAKPNLHYTADLAIHISLPVTSSNVGKTSVDRKSSAQCARPCQLKVCSLLPSPLVCE